MTRAIDHQSTPSELRCIVNHDWNIRNMPILLLVFLEQLRECLKASKKSRVIISSKFPFGAISDDKRVTFVFELSWDHYISVPNYYIHRDVSIFFPMTSEDIDLVMCYNLLNNKSVRRFYNQLDGAWVYSDGFSIRSKGKTDWLRP